MYRVLSSTDTVVAAPFATPRSSMPSPLTSIATTDGGPVPVAKACWVAKLGVAAPGVVVLSSTEIVVPPLFVAITSGLPSPLISATANA